MTAPRRAPGRALLACGAAGWLLVGCLPKESLSRRDEVEADVYALVMDMDVRTSSSVPEGVAVPPFRWHVEGTVTWSYTRTFRDGSMGHLVRLVDTSAQVSRDGGAPVPVRGPADGAHVEVRAFPDGQVLAVTGASAWTGGADHLEVLDVLWPVLSPHLPASRADAAEPFITSWPTWIEGGPKVRTRLEASWDAQGKSTWSYAGRLEGQGGYVSVAGTANGKVVLGAAETRVLTHSFDWSRAVTTTWAGGRTVTQDQHLTGSLRHTGRAPAPPLDMPIASDDVAADARPLRLRDGRVVEDRPVDLPSTLPFLLLPDDLPPEEVARLRAAVTGAGSM